MNELDLVSSRPYLIRALHEWCCDNGYTPYIVVSVDETVQVPREYVKDGEIVLNISVDATGSLTLGNDFVEFKARFGGVAREIMIPVRQIIAVYARENGQGIAFPQLVPTQPPGKDAGPKMHVLDDKTDHGHPKAHPILSLTEKVPPDDAPKPPSGPRPALKRVK